MKRIITVLLLLSFLLLLTSCTDKSTASISSEATNQISTEDTTPTESNVIVENISTMEPSTEAMIEAVTESTEMLHSTLYIPDVDVEDVIHYFNEVCLDAEFVNSGDPSRLQKWLIPISYAIHGNYTDTDMEVFSQFVDWLNQVEGFPGISPVQDGQLANLNIHFCDEKEMRSIMGDNFSNMDGAVTFWYENDAIFNAIICYRTDVLQETRNSVILEEIYNGLGPIQDTDLRDDSIIYSGFSTPQSLTPMDELILRLLYQPAMECGMNAQQCEDVIRSLYY